MISGELQILDEPKEEFYASFRINEHQYCGSFTEFDRCGSCKNYDAQRRWHCAGLRPKRFPAGCSDGRDIVTRCVAVQSDPVQTKVQDLMTRNVVTISPNEEMKTAADLLSGEQIRRIPVVEGTRVVGMLSLADLVHSDLYDMEAAQALTEITSPTREY